MFRLILSFFGGIFTTLTMSIGMVALTIGAVFWMYGRDLPSHESLAQYAPDDQPDLFGAGAVD